VTQLGLIDDGTAGATFDPTRTYRYRLWRKWGEGKGTVCWLMLNPSTADETVLDPTLRRCKGYSRAWGYSGMEIINLYALRSTDPAGLWRVDDPVGPGNDEAILEAVEACDLVVAGWGGNAKPERVEFVRGLLSGTPIFCLKTNGDGSPGHPLYLPKTLGPTLLWKA